MSKYPLFMELDTNLKKSNLSFFKKHFLLTTSIAFLICSCFILITAFLTFYLQEPVPAVKIAKIVDSAADTERQRIASGLKNVLSDVAVIDVRILNGESQLIDEMKKNSVDVMTHLQKFQKSEEHYYAEKGLNFFTPKAYAIFKSENTPDQYFAVEINRTNSRTPTPIWIFFVSLVIVILLSTSVSAVFMYKFFAKFAWRAREVIEDIKNGDLKSRFIVDRDDEIGMVMDQFNRMADHVEKHILTLKETEQNRVRVLQELAHDLRTPIASQKNLIDLLINKKDLMSEQEEEEFLNLAFKEVSYFERLVEDLLFLARVSEPKYQKFEKEVDLKELVLDEARKSVLSLEDKKVNIDFDDSNQDLVYIRGDQHLIRRLFRNIFENAVSFASEKISLRISYDEVSGTASVVVTDDGPGFSDEAIESFGKRRVSREWSEGKGGRVSLGLGSVIAKSIVQMHEGEIYAYNSKNYGGTVRVVVSK